MPAPAYRWLYLGLLAGLVLLRGLGYWQMGIGVRWTPVIDLGAIVIPFRSDKWLRMLAFSPVSLAVFVAEFYFCLLLFSAVNRKVADTEPLQNQIRAHLGWIDRWPGFVKLLLPFLLAGPERAAAPAPKPEPPAPPADARNGRSGSSCIRS